MRINIINPEMLLDQHLVAEYREIKMLPKALSRTIGSKKGLQIDKISDTYTLNKGHGYFFYNKLSFIKKRFNKILKEMRKRGFKTDSKELFDKDYQYNDFPKDIQIEYKPTKKEKRINILRIIDRFNEKSHLYKYRGNKVENIYSFYNIKHSCDIHQNFDDSKSDSDGIIKKKYDFVFDTLPFHKGYFDDIKKNSLNNTGKKIQEDIRKFSGFIKHDSDKIRYDLVCPYAYEDLGKVLTFGAKKYEDNNWIKGDINTYIAAMERHLAEVKKAVNSGNNDLFIDDNSGLQHGAALMVNGMFIHWFINQKVKGDK